MHFCTSADGLNIVYEKKIVIVYCYFLWEYKTTGTLKKKETKA
jgi:hypothetical protein